MSEGCLLIVWLFGLSCAVVMIVYSGTLYNKYKEWRFASIAKDLAKMRSYSLKEETKLKREQEKRIKKLAAVTAEDLKRKGEARTEHKDVAEWFKGNGYEVTPPNHIHYNYIIKIPNVTDKELTDIILGTKK